jgi:branched-chain amino acid transport system substrate-binding protein
MRRSLLLAGFVCAALVLRAEAAEPDIKLGVLADMTGTSADIGGAGSVAAVELAVEDFGGTVAGRHVTVLSADHLAKPDVGAQIASRWYDVDGVDAILDLPVSSVALAVQQVATSRNKVVLVTAGTAWELTGRFCSPTTIHWADDTNALGVGTAKAVLKSGGRNWFFITVDFVFGHSMEQAASEAIRAAGGAVLGHALTPLNTADYSSPLLAARASGAQMVGLVEVGSDFINVVKQASEFGLVASGQKMVGFLVYLSDIHSLGLAAAHGLLVTESFYWDRNDETRAFAKRFMARRHVMPTKAHAANYAATIHYLNAIKATGSTDSATTMAWMKSHKADYFGQEVRIREDGRAMFDLDLYEVKSPGESRYPWDYYKKVGSLSAEDAFRPLDRKACKFLAAPEPAAR